ncbi:MAG: hypothetical protein ACE5Q3_15280, partial [Alphaproteobacteria bacterium]
RYLAGGLAASIVIAASLGLTWSLLGPSYQVLDTDLADSRSPFGNAEDRLASGPVAQNEPTPSFRESELPTAATEAPSGIVDAPSDVAGGDLDDDQERSDAARLAQKPGEADEFRPREEEQGRLAERSFFDRANRQEAEQRHERELDIIAQLTAPLSYGERGAGLALEKPAEEVATGRLVETVPHAQPTIPAPAPTTKTEGRYRGELEDEPRRIARDLRLREPAQVRAGEEVPESMAKSSRAKSAEAKDRAAAQDKELAASLSEADPSAEGRVGASGLLAPQAAAPVGGEVVSHEYERRSLALPMDPESARVLARNFLESYRSLDDLSFQEPVGYWANTYIPGDPAMRLLEARLGAWNRTALGQNVRLEQAVRQVRQPFDAPRDAALAVYLDADAPAIEGPTRLRVQVGLKGAERQGGHRPAMNIGLVVDLRTVGDAGTGARIRALISALEQARQPEDRFSLTVAGPSGGLLVPPERFRHGPLRMAIDRMFGSTGHSPSPAVDLPQALALATESVRRGDDPEAILGSSLVLLVTGSSLANDLPALERMAHRNAVGGVPLSVVSMAIEDDLAHIDRLVAAGQGNRRILDSAQAADALIDRELHAASQAVARALRLRIRLAPGVELIDVLGSRPLGEPQAQRVREAEQAIDRRLARNLGIQADRGEDEEGIQIVIPNFHAGDAHVILLDVVAEGPGPVADVTVRYKDVVHLRNSVARASLTIDDDRGEPGPLERNVLKNLVAWEFARETRQVGRYLAADDPRRAASLIASLRDLIHGLRLEVPGWSTDPDLAADEAMLNEYLAVLASPAAGDIGQRQYLADSLRYAAFRKLQSAAR